VAACSNKRRIYDDDLISRRHLISWRHLIFCRQEVLAESQIMMAGKLFVYARWCHPYISVFISALNGIVSHAYLIYGQLVRPIGSWHLIG